MTRRLWPWLGSMLLLACACGPDVTLQASLDGRAVNIKFGAQSQPASPNPVQTTTFPGFPTPFIAAPSAQLVLPPSPPNPCPEAPPTAVVRVPVVATPASPPLPATYDFRYFGALTTDPSGADRAQPLPHTGTKQVTNVSPVGPNADYTFDVVEKFNAITTTTTYHVLPHGPLPNALENQTPESGLYLNRIVQSGPAAYSFSPTPEVLLMPYPAQSGTTFQGGGTDGANNRAMEIDPNGGTINDQDLVNACGQVVQAWSVTIKGRTVDARSGSNGVKTFTITFDNATQYGSIDVAEHVVEDYVDPASGVQMHLDVQDIIDSVPVG